MASEASVKQAVELLLAGSRERYRSAKEDSMRIAAFKFATDKFSDAAVGAAAVEWLATMDVMPSVHEFIDVCRRQQNAFDDERAIAAGPVPMPTYAVGKPGSEGLATQIVLQRMLDAVAREAPNGYLGRARGLKSANITPGSHQSLRDLGHDFDENGHREDCVRCHALATIAYEQVVEFEHSTATWDGWEGPDVEGLRSCRNALCDHGWVTTATMEQGRIVDRVDKCETCGGPKPPRLPKDAETITARRHKRRRY